METNTDPQNGPVRVLFLNYCLAIGGIETMLLGFLRAMSGTRFIPHMALFEGGGVLESEVRSLNIPLIQLNKKSGLDVALVWRLAKTLRQHDIDVIHTNNFATWLYAVAAKIMRPGLRIVHTEHSTVRGHKKRRYLLERLLALFTFQVVTVSQKVKDNMVELCGVESERIRVVPNGIDTDLFHGAEAGAPRSLDDFPLPGTGPVYGTVGRLVPVKDHVSLVKAFGLLLDSVPDASLLIIGDGPCRDDIEQQISRLGIGGSVFLAGERHDIPVLLRSMDCYVVSSLSEGMSISILEAMSSALPIVATNVGGNPELVSEGENGLLVEAANPEALCEAMLKLAKATELRQDMAKESRQKVVQNFSHQAMLSQYQGFYDGKR